jgi:DNA-binding MarR family transcriptional regulator
MARDLNLAETVKLLDEVSGQNSGNQRALAQQIGISLGLVNALVHRAVKKGLIKIKGAPTRRYAYYLTPKGFSEKSRLVAQYLDHSLTFFRTARQEYSDAFAACAAANRKRIILCGAGELAEIATLSASGLGVELVCILDLETNQVRVADLPVVRDLASIQPGDILVVTDGRKPQEVYDRLVDATSPERVIAPPFLRITRRGDRLDVGDE